MCSSCACVERDEKSATILVFDVDDLIITGSSEMVIFLTKTNLRTPFAMKDLGDVSLILRTQVSRDHIAGKQEISPVHCAHVISRGSAFSNADPYRRRGLENRWTSTSATY